MEYQKNIGMLPSHMREPMLKYIEHGWLPGGFLTAVLENNLCEAVNRADTLNINRIPDCVHYLMWYAPGLCWGSPEKVGLWHERGGMKGER